MTELINAFRNFAKDPKNRNFQGRLKYLESMSNCKFGRQYIRYIYIYIYNYLHLVIEEQYLPGNFTCNFDSISKTNTEENVKCHKESFKLLSETDNRCGNNRVLFCYLVTLGLYSRHSDQLTGLIISSFFSVPTTSRFWYNTLKTFMNISLIVFPT
jgi:hypothetical protein